MQGGTDDSGARSLVPVVAFAAILTVVVAAVAIVAIVRGSPRRPAARPAPVPADRPTDRDARAEAATAVSEPAAPVAITGDAIDRGIRTAPGFVTELVHVVPPESGSWVSLAVDDAGRLIASDQQAGLYRITPAPLGAPPESSVVERLDVEIGGAQGLLCVGDDLYCMVNGERPSGPGLYRLRDSDGDDRYDTVTHLREVRGGGEHGPHALVLGPDGSLYTVAGNHTALPDPERSAVPRVWGEDHLLPRLWDARGHAVGILAPGGWICRTDLEGRTWELVASGFRNPYDIAFDEAGELFTYDADMEWDMGAPWYRPTRINHVVSGGEYGWRSGTAKWPTHWLDSLPAVVDIGPGSPTGIVFGTGADFPPRYQRALFALDWTFGTIYAVHLEPAGATYRAVDVEPFVTGRPLPVADAVVRPADGALYFVVGGRGIASAVYRVRAVDGAAPDTAPAAAPPAGAQEARNLRRRLEALHTDTARPGALDGAWAHLDSDDRFVRYAARVALEHQPVENWIERAWREPSPAAQRAALLAVIRTADETHAPRVIEALGATRWDDLDRAGRLEWLRLWALCFIRMGPPDEISARRLATRLGRHYPTGDETIDRELCDLLVYLRWPPVVARTIPLMERMDTDPVPNADPELLARSDQYGHAILAMAAAPPQRQQVHYALALRNAEVGWTATLRERYFRWFETARRTSGGHSFTGFLDAIRASALEAVPEDRREQFARIGTGDEPGADTRPAPKGPGRQWTVPDVLAAAVDGLRGRDFENGRRMYAAASCLDCHRFAGTGRIGGPDLTAVATRYTLRDLVESIVEPSRAVSDQYLMTELLTSDDRIVIGRIVDEDDTTVRMLPSLLAPDVTIDVSVADIVERRPSPVSPMPPNLVDALSKDELLDLLAYLLAEGDPRSGHFQD
jgi:putative heme-binding domain-containing protein